jgi:cell filamentation protein, protein adenylyltransferase
MPRGRPSRATIHARLDEQVSELRARLGGLPSPEEAEGIWTDIWYQEAHHQRLGQGTACFSWQRNARDSSAVGTCRN